MTLFSAGRIVLGLGLAWLGTAKLVSQTAATKANQFASAVAHGPQADQVVLPASVPDPIEPFNRIMWGVNRELMIGVVKPTSRLYRVVIRKPARTGISNFGRNITYPGLLVNNLLQAKWQGARDETHRFFCNTIVGAAGFVDVATRWKIPKAEADFGQTFGKWGWKPACYVMLPVFGPSNERDTLGLVADNAVNPLTYVTPYSISTHNVLTFFSPYMYFSYAVIYNNLSDSVDGYVRFAESTPDPYALVQYAWTFVRKDRAGPAELNGEQDLASLQTLQSAFVVCQDPFFPASGQTRSVEIPGVGKRLKFTYWLQTDPAPVVYIVPGLGSHRLVDTAMSLAELFYRNGFSVVSVSNPFNPEFMEHASTAAVPGYTPVDAHDLHVALTEIHHRLEVKYPGKLGPKALLGYSMGGFETLLVAAAAATNRGPLLAFDRYVAIDAPVRLEEGIRALDEFYNAPLAWPPEERTADIENIFLKVAAVSRTGLTPQSAIPLNAIESKFLVGLAFRFVLRDVIYSSQRRDNQGVLHTPLRKLRRDALYHEIMQYSFQDYFQKFVIPYYLGRGADLTTPEAFARAGDLRTYVASLRANPKVQLLVNENDFLLAHEDLEWLRATFGPRQLTVFPEGGHLGNLGASNVQSVIVGKLAPLR